MSTSSKGAHFFRTLCRKFSSKPPVRVKIVTSHDAKPGDPIWFDVENNCGRKIVKLTIDCANAFRNPAGLSFFRFNALEELSPDSFENIAPGSNRLCSHYQIPKKREDKVYLGLLIVKAEVELSDGRQFTIQKVNLNALSSSRHDAFVMPSAAFPPTGNYVTDLPQNFFGYWLDAVKEYFAPVGRRNIRRLKDEITSEREKKSAPPSGKPDQTVS
jgi:hypothetical protein